MLGEHSNVHHLPPSGMVQPHDIDSVSEDVPSTKMLMVWDHIENEHNIQDQSQATTNTHVENTLEAEEDDKNNDNDSNEDLAAHPSIPINPEGACNKPTQKPSKPVHASKYEETEPSMAEFLYVDILPIGHPL